MKDRATAYRIALSISTTATELLNDLEDQLELLQLLGHNRTTRSSKLDDAMEVFEVEDFPKPEKDEALRDAGRLEKLLKAASAKIRPLGSGTTKEKSKKLSNKKMELLAKLKKRNGFGSADLKRVHSIDLTAAIANGEKQLKVPDSKFGPKKGQKKTDEEEIFYYFEELEDSTTSTSTTTTTTTITSEKPTKTPDFESIIQQIVTLKSGRRFVVRRRKMSKQEMAERFSRAESGHETRPDATSPISEIDEKSATTTVTLEAASVASESYDSEPTTPEIRKMTSETQRIRIRTRNRSDRKTGETGRHGFYDANYGKLGLKLKLEQKLSFFRRSSICSSPVGAIGWGGRR
ncbi:unnamed protein product, partial [Mesorhabditis spiculigera]